MRKFKDFFDDIEVQACWKAIKNAKTFALLGHKDPDRDAVFSCLAMAEVLDGLGKQVQIIFPNKTNFKIDSPTAPVLAGKHNFVPDVVMVFDTGVKSRCYLPEAFEGCLVINVDHHMANSINGKFNFVDTDASSACEVLARLIFKWDEGVLTPTVSHKLMIGVLDDSIVFKTTQSGVSALDTATKLIGFGADFKKAKKTVALHRTPDIVKGWAELISKGRNYPDKSLFVIAVDEQAARSCGLRVTNLEGLVNTVAELISCDVVALVREVGKGQVKGSLRSKSRDVMSVAGKLGGGGHKNAAGFTVAGTVDQAVEELLQALG